jgi:putative PEP-CTERM system histidine kinase
MRATEALLEAKKFDSFNRMSAFVVHDMKNLVAQLSLLSKNAERHKDNPEFQADMLLTIDNAVERMKQLLLQLRAGTTPINGPSPVNLAPIVGRIEKARSGQMPHLTIEKGDDIEVLGHADRLERVIGHLVQNAIDATPDDGKVWLKLLRDNDQAIVEVGDTGHGMSREFVREGMFKPFRSTKAAGMGIGAYESSQYIRELGGRIVVDSRENEGTVVRIELRANRPKADLAAGIKELSHG